MLKKKSVQSQIKLLKSTEKEQLSASRTPEILSFLTQSPPFKPFSPVLFSQNHSQGLVNKINQLKTAKNHLISEINESINEKKFERQNSFHKMKDFIDRKTQIKQNVKEHKLKSSENLSKLISIIESEPQPKTFITKEDIANERSAEFLSKNKRNFGESAKVLVTFRNQKKKRVKETVRTPSLPEVPISNPLKSVASNTRKSVDIAISNKTNKYILTEMKKIFPTDINLLKKKALHSNIEKIDLVLQDSSPKKSQKLRKTSKLYQK